MALIKTVVVKVWGAPPLVRNDDMTGGAQRRSKHTKGTRRKTRNHMITTAAANKINTLLHRE